MCDSRAIYDWISYSFTQTPLAERRRRLASTYMFDCKCDACKTDYPTLKRMDAGLPSKGLKKQLDKLLSSYQQSFSIGDVEQAKRYSQNYLLKLKTAGVAYPHKNYDVGGIALNSCWWAIIANAGGGNDTK
jgi:predicted SprT family Zn-dependent metalloprotease